MWVKKSCWSQEYSLTLFGVFYHVVMPACYRSLLKIWLNFFYDLSKILSAWKLLLNRHVALRPWSFSTRAVLKLNISETLTSKFPCINSWLLGIGLNSIIMRASSADQIYRIRLIFILIPNREKRIDQLLVSEVLRKLLWSISLFLCCFTINFLI